ncbi:hypothetical protein N2152v2_004452 [Parachlorella kessleri]
MDKALHKLRVKFTVDLHPSKLSSVEKGVREHLNTLLLRYNEDLDGVLLSYSSERILTHQAHIHPYFPLVRVEVAADAVLFRPQAGMRLVGTVNKIGADFIGLLVLGVINAAIGAERVRQDIHCRFLESCWRSQSNPTHVIEVGTQVYFRLAEVQLLGGYVSLVGDLRSSDTGAQGFASAGLTSRATKAAKSEKKKNWARDRLNAASVSAAQHEQQLVQKSEQQQQQQQQQPVSGMEKQRLSKARPSHAPAPLVNGGHAAAQPPEQQQQQQQPEQQQQQPSDAGKSKKSAEKLSKLAAHPAQVSSQEQLPRPDTATNGSLGKGEAAATLADGLGRAEADGTAAATVGKKAKKRKAPTLGSTTPSAAAPGPDAAGASAGKKKKRRKKADVQ